MAYSFEGRTLTKVGIVGSGQIGPDIALYFSKVLGDTPVVVVDISNEALETGRTRVEKKIAKGVETGAFKPDQAKTMLSNLTFTSDYEALRGADLVVEAATESQAIKRRIVAQLEALCPADAILASNSSHMEPEDIFEESAHPERTMVIHYFFPAERNPVVEIVPSKHTDAQLARWALRFFEAVGKVPILVQSRYGYAVDPIFEGMCQAAILGVEAGWGTVKQVDAMVARALGLGVGPFTAANLTGGNPILDHGLDEMGRRLGRWFGSPRLLKEQLLKGQPWDVAARGESVQYSDQAYEKVAYAMTGAYFGLVGQILDSGITSVADLEMALEIALVVRAPFAWMNEVGPRRALALVEAYAAEHPDFAVPHCLVEQAASGASWEIPVVLREDCGGVAVLKIRRPRVLNALNRDVLDQLYKHAEAVRDDESVVGMVLTGFGNKAFVSGADIGMLAAITSPEAGEVLSAGFQETLNFLEDFPKPVVCALNGLALGGGSELAAACHARLASRVLIGQPEVNLGIIPAAGGTQRLPRWIGVEPAARMMRTGAPISSAEARSLGLVRDVVEKDLLGAAVDLVKMVASGETTLAGITRGPLADVPDTLPELPDSHLSAAVDRILCKAIVEGARLPLRKGLEVERAAFAECCRLKDMKIGLNNFITNGPRSKARFVHR